MILGISFDFNYLPLLVVIALAWLVPLTMSLFRVDKVPTIIIEILAGFFIGRFLIGNVAHESEVILDFFALTGFLFLMFLSGLEIDVDKILASFPRKRISYSRFIKNPLLVGLVFFVITLILAYFSAYALSFFTEVNNIFYFSLILVTSSVGIIVPVLKNRGEIGTRFGQMIILAAAVADILSILLFSFTAFTIKRGFRIELLLILSLFVAFFIFYRVGLRLRRLPIVKKLSYQLAHAASQLPVRSSLLVILGFVVLAQLIGEEVMLLGAFLGGLLLSFFLHKERSILMLKLDGMGYGFFIPIFFIMVGVHFDASALRDLDSTLFIYLGALLIILYAVKVIPAFLWQRLFGRKNALAGGFLLASRLSLIIAAAQIGLDLGIISPAINASFILMAVVTCILSPTLYNSLSPRLRFTGDETIIVGGSSTGVLLARRLKMHGKSSVIIENNKERFAELESKGLNVISGEADNPEIYEKIKLRPWNYVVIETANHETNLKICQMLKEEYEHANIITKSATTEINRVLNQLNIETLDVTRTLATTIENLIMRPTTYHALVETFDKFNVEEVKVTNKSVDRLQVKEIPFHEDGFLMLVRRGTDMIVPHGDTHIQLGDEVVIFATDSAMKDFIERLV